jgi:predicted RNA-binding protein with PUA-like domain
MPQYWLVKSEPEEWSFDQHVKAVVSPWTGVKNAQAQNHMKEMRKGDLAFFYHTGDEKQIVGTLSVVCEFRIDGSDPARKLGHVTFRAGARCTPVTLAQLKADKRLKHLPLIKQPRLSVMPIDTKAAAVLCEMTGVKA